MSENKATVLWVDLNVKSGSCELRKAFGRHWDIRRAGEETAASTPPQLICFEYDYPDRSGLSLLQQTKKSYPSIPILMLTLQHSEALAVWAFRARVCDYLVKPVAREEIDRVCSRLTELVGLRHRSPARRPIECPSVLPTEVRFSTDLGRWDVRPALEYVHTHFAEKISEQMLAELCGMNRFTFSRAFHKTQGVTFNDYLVSYRMREACRLLSNPDISVTDVALMVSYSDVSHFGRMFRRHCGELPSAYKARMSRCSAAAPGKARSDDTLRASLIAAGLSQELHEAHEAARVSVSR